MVAARLPLLCILILALGCGQGTSSQNTVPVEGTVELNSQPMEKGEVFFASNDGKAQVKIDIQAGKFSGKVPPGDYTVRFSATKEVPNPMHSPATPGSTPTHTINIVPARYAADSKEVAKVTESGPNKFTYTLKDK